MIETALLVLIALLAGVLITMYLVTEGWVSEGWGAVVGVVFTVVAVVVVRAS